MVVVVLGGGDGILIGSLVCSGKSERPIKWSMVKSTCDPCTLAFVKWSQLSFHNEIPYNAQVVVLLCSRVYAVGKCCTIVHGFFYGVLCCSIGVP